MNIFLAACALLVQEGPEAALARKCDSQIPWITDGVTLPDNAQPGVPAPGPAAHRSELLDRAQKLAADKKRLILWYCVRVPGTHMYRSTVLDAYMRSAVFTDPGVVDLVRAKFVPLRMVCDPKTSQATGVKAFDFVEPGLIVLTPEGKVVHTLDRIRTFNADWIRAALVAVLRANPEFNAPAGDTPEDLIRGGDDEKAWEQATPDRKALILRRAGKFEEVLRLDCSPAHKGIALLGLKRFDEARQALEGQTSPEALYFFSAAEAWSGRDAAPRWKALVERHPDSPWAWRAASNLAKGKDTVRDGPLAHLFEDFFLRPPDGLPTSTRLPAKDADAAARSAVEFLLRAQRENGAWNDSRYSYWPGPEILPNVFVAVTALSALALSEWRDVDPAGVDAAVARAEKYLLDDAHVARGRNEECYAEAYRLLYLVRKKDTARMNRVVTRLAGLQDKDGYWGHEYPNPFSTAAVVHCLSEAKKAGADVPESYFRKAADALLRTRGDDGRQAYEAGRPPSAAKDSAGRTALCELALYECGKGSTENVAAGLDAYRKFLSRLDAVRVCDFHSDGELAGFFYFYDLFHSVEAARALPKPARTDHLKKFREQVLGLPEWDGSFVDSHELGKSYGTAMALLVLSRTR